MCGIFMKEIIEIKRKEFEVIEKLGFVDYSYFCKVFKKVARFTKIVEEGKDILHISFSYICSIL